MMSYQLGVRVHREQPPDTLLDHVREIERLGFDDAWVVEDLGFGGGLTAAAAALAATSDLRVGIGILAAVVRNPAYLAMELATLERIFPGRVIAGIGHGVQAWMTSVGTRAASPLTALGETLTAVEQLLSGKATTIAGRYVRLDDVHLTFPPAVRPPVLAGVRGPKSLTLAGGACDGVLLAEPATPAYIGWARALLDQAAVNAGRPRPELAVYAWFSVDTDSQTAQARLRPTLVSNLSGEEVRVHLRDLPFADELARRVTLPASPAETIELDWVRQLGIVGTPGECATAIEELARAGADRIILLPLPGDELAQLRTFAASVRPFLR